MLVFDVETEEVEDCDCCELEAEDWELDADDPPVSSVRMKPVSRRFDGPAATHKIFSQLDEK